MDLILKHLRWIFLVIGFGLVALTFYLKKEQISQIDFYPEPEDKLLAFHPDSVIQFSWSIDKNRKARFDRKNRDNPWQPAHGQQGVQERLNLLSQAHLAPFSFSGPGLITISLTFSNQETWTGSWDGENFIWTSGNFINQGVKLNQRQNLLFLAGRHAFERKEFDWCHERPMSFNIRTVQKTLIYQQEHQWIKKADDRETDVTHQVEQWLAKYCTLRAEQFIDLKFYNEPASDRGLMVEFVDKTQVRWQRVKDDIYMTNTRGMVSAELGRAISELESL